MGKVTTDIVQELEKLTKLHQDGLLTGAEFSRAKNRLLSLEESESIGQQSKFNITPNSPSKNISSSRFPSQLNQLRGSDDHSKCFDQHKNFYPSSNHELTNKLLCQL